MGQDHVVLDHKSRPKCQKASCSASTILFDVHKKNKQTNKQKTKQNKTKTTKITNKKQQQQKPS